MKPYSLLCVLLISLSLVASLMAQQKTPLSIEKNYLDQRANLISLQQANSKLVEDSVKRNVMTERLAIMFSSNQESAMNALATLDNKSHEPHSLWLMKVIKEDTLTKKMPFDLVKYLPRHTFQTYNTFTLPVEKRTLVTLQFKADGWQYTNGKKGQYQYKMESPTSFRRTRPLKGGGFGTDVISYNPLKNRFEKNGKLFMWSE